MAFTATAIGRVRIGGNDANGAFYDGSAYPGGVDYSQQDAAQASGTNLTVDVTTNTDVAPDGYTPVTADVGNAIRITSGTGFTVGYYFITSIVSGKWRLDRSPAAAGTAGGVWKMGGAGATIRRVTNNANATGDKPVPGSTVYVRGSGASTWTETTATGSVTSAAGQVLAVASASGFPSNGSFYAQIDTEVIQVTAGAGTTSWTLGARGLGSSTAASHSSGARVQLIDYIESAGVYNFVSGDTTNGHFQVLGENGRPAVALNGRWTDIGASYAVLSGFLISLYAAPGATAAATFGSTSLIRDVFIDCHGLTITTSILGSSGSSPSFFNCEVWGGTTSPSGTSAVGISSANGGSVVNCFVHNIGGKGISGGDIIVGNTVSRCLNDSITLSVGSFADHAHLCALNTVDNGSGNGIAVSSLPSGAGSVSVFGNLITNHAAGTGLIVTSDTQALNDKSGRFVDYNFIYNCATLRSGISAGPHDVTGTDPGYTDSSNSRYPNYSIGTALKGVSFPNSGWSKAQINGSALASIFTSYMDPGAVQRQEAGGGGGGLLTHPGMSGGMRG